MRTLKILLALVVVIFSGFSKDSQTDENGLLKKGTESGIVIPIKVSGSTIPNSAGGTTMCIPAEYKIAHTRYGWMQGNQSHGGKLIPELSTWEITSCSTDLTNKLNFSKIKGVNTVANGDSYSYDCMMIINIVTNKVTLEVTITDGVGRYEGATGQLMLTGDLNNSVVTFSGEGYLSLPK